MKRQPSIDRYFTGRMFTRQFFPALISAIVLSFGDVADGLVLGNSVGYVGLAAIALTMPVAQIFNVIMNGLGIGGSVRFSHQMAQGKTDEALQDFQGILLVTLIAGMVTALLGNLFMTPLLRLLGASPEDELLFSSSRIYLRVLLMGTPMLFLNYVLNYYLKNDDMEKQASLAFTIGNIVDISLNILLVLFLHMGVAGASLATITGQTVGMSISLFIIARKKRSLRLFPFKPNLSHVLSAFSGGFSSSVEYLYSLVFMLIANRLLIRTLGGGGVAIFDVVLSVSYFMYNIFDASAKSVMPVISTYHGEHNESGTKLGLSTGMRYTLASGVVVSLVVYIFAEMICHFFGLSDPGMLQEGIAALRCFALCIPLVGVSMIWGCFYEAKEQQRVTLFLYTLRGILPIGLALFFAFFYPYAFWYLYAATEILTLCIFSVYLRHIHISDIEMDRVFRKTIYSRGKEIAETTQQIQDFCDHWQIPLKRQYAAGMAVEELCVATLDNGFLGKENGFFQITLIFLNDGTLELHIRDNADSFNPMAMEMNQRLDDENVNLDALGIMAIKKKAKSSAYRNYQGFNTVILWL